MKEILTPVQTRNIMEMMENVKKNYIPLIDDEEKRKKVENKYLVFESNFTSFVANLKLDMYNKKNYNNTLLTPKIDPYIAGGAASSIAGISGGAYVATSTSINNKSIDNQRSYWKMQSVSSTAMLNSEKENLIKIAEELNNLLDEIPAVCEKRNEIKEKDYQKAIAEYKTFSLKKVKNSEALFTGLSNYKDACDYASEASAKKELLDILYHEGVSLAIALILSFIFSLDNSNLTHILILVCFIIIDINLRLLIRS